MNANNRQVAGEHYKGTIQHWDFVVAQNLDYFQAQITKYVSRHKKKNGLQDLEKAKHFLEKYIEVVQAAENEGVYGGGPTAAYVNQD
jgi:lipopolysaccharide biosynthesis regulator YciM